MGHFVVGVGCYHHNRKTYCKEGKDIELHKGKEKILAGLGLFAVKEGCKKAYGKTPETVVLYKNFDEPPYVDIKNITSEKNTISRSRIT